MRRVRHDDGRILHCLLRRRLVEDFIAELALGLLDFLRAFHLLVFALHLVLRHHHLLHEILLLEEEVRERDDYVAEARVDGQILEHPAEDGEDAVLQVAVAERQQDGDRFLDELVDKISQESDFQGVLEQFKQIFLAEYLLRPLHGVDFVQIRLERLEREEEADLRKLRGHACDGRRDADDERIFDDDDGRRLHPFVDGRLVFGAEKLRQEDEKLLQVPHQHGRQDADDSQKHQQQGRGGDVLAVVDLTLFACVPQLFRGRHFGFFAAFAHGL